MPIEKCEVNGKSGHRFGKSGKCYTGKDSAKRAAAQGLAELGSKKFKEEMSKAGTGEFDSFDYLDMSRAIDEYESAQAKIIPFGDKYKVVGQGQVFDSREEAIAWKLGVAKADDNRKVSDGQDEENELKKTGAAIKKEKDVEHSDDDEDGLAEGNTRAAKYYQNDPGADRPYMIEDQAEPMPYKKLSRPKQILKETAKALYERSISYISKEERDKISQEDCAGPDKSFPCDTLEHFKSACKLYGRAENPEAVKRNIIKIAKRKGFKLPKSWTKE